MNETRVQEATVLSHGPDSDCPPLLDTIESNPRVADEATGPRLNRSTPPPSNFDFTRLCDQWKGVGVSFRDDDGAGDRDSRHLMKPDRCNRQCDGCKILLRAVRPIKAMISSREGRQLASRDELQCQVRLRSHTKASFLSIANPSMLGPAASIYAAKDAGAANPWNLTGSPSVLLEGFDAIMDLVRHWLGRCSREHSRCRVGADPQLPTRVLDLGSSASDTIKLHEPKGGKGRYICLTYCWGTSEFIKTKQATLESHKQGIGFEKLPQTFRDTVQIARALGIKYLWIDSLCIVQDDDADWRRESKLMADVYRHSYLTVAPSWADSPDSGCFGTPDRRCVENEAVNIRFIDHFPDTNFLERDQFKDFPLLSRAWTYQERMLSPRILYFGKQEMLWDCREKRTCECGQAKYGVNEVNKGDFHDMMSNSLSRPGHTEQMLWRHMVVQYMPLNLTYRTDRLPAFDGLAAEMQRCSKQQYLAGLWRETLIQDMCWMVERDDNTQKGIGRGKTVSPDILHWPTWSWASVHEPVVYPFFLYNKHSARKSDDIRESPQILDVKLPLQDPSTIGGAQNGFVELSCCLLPAKLKSKQRVHVVSADFYYRLDRGFSASTRGSGEYYLIPMLTSPDFCGLIVQQRDGPDPLESWMVRIGLVHIDNFLDRRDLTRKKLEKLLGPNNKKVRIF